MRTCSGCGKAIYLTVSGNWNTSGGAAGGICRPTEEEIAMALRAYGVIYRPHIPLNLQVPESVERWLAS